MDREKNTKNGLDVAFWNQRWLDGTTGWDIGYASPPITDFLSGYDQRDARILIPGCGNAYEAEFLSDNGFSDIVLLDIAPEAVRRLKEKFTLSKAVTVACGDFFEHEGKYDLILEQTFFCAQVLERREEYVEKVHTLLNPGGILAGVLFNIDFEQAGPPFGGDIEEYRRLFEPYFNIAIMQPCYNSIAPRAGSELFVKMIKK